jgi:hypothetical protein
MTDSPQILGDRGRTLEDEFFRKEDQRFTQRLRELQEKATSLESLGKASGIRNEAILEKLLHLGVQAETVAALALVPLVEVAWADGAIDERERQEILGRAGTSGLAAGSPSQALLQTWLERRPEPKLLSAWIQMVKGLSEHMTPEQVRVLRADLIERARAVASASGGLLGVGKVSAAETDMIKRLEAAFDQSKT